MSRSRCGTRAELLADFMQKNSVVPFDRAIQSTVANRFFALHEVWFPDRTDRQNVTNPPLDSHFRGAADIATFRSAWNDTNAIFVGFQSRWKFHRPWPS